MASSGAQAGSTELSISFIERPLQSFENEALLGIFKFEGGHNYQFQNQPVLVATTSRSGSTRPAASVIAASTILAVVGY